MGGADAQAGAPLDPAYSGYINAPSSVKRARRDAPGSGYDWAHSRRAERRGRTEESSMLCALRAGLFILAMLHSLAASPQSYPERPVTLVVPSTPGSTPDVLGRVVAENLSQQLGQQLVVINRAGAGTRIGSAAVANAAPDGYTLLLGSETGIHPESAHRQADELPA